MKSFITTILLIVLLSQYFISCENVTLPSSDNEEHISKEANSLLQIQTRAAESNEESTVSYPVHVYVFQEEECVAVQMIENESQSLSFMLPKGIYSVYAIGGATNTNYILPSKEDASPSMTIALREGKKHGDLMVAKNTVELKDGENNIVTLGMKRKVMMIESLTIEGVFSSAKSVSITLSPLYKNIAGTGFSDELTSVEIPLTKQNEEGLWQLDTTEPIYLLPPSEKPADITVRISKSGGVSSGYTYNTELLESNCKINIRGRYTEKGGVTLLGTITGSHWEERDIVFMFNESGSYTDDESENKNDQGDEDEKDDKNKDEAEDDNDKSDKNLQVGDIYEGCFVLSVEKQNEEMNVLLLSPNQQIIEFQKSNVTLEEATKIVEDAFPKSIVEKFDGWRLMTKEEAQYFYDIRKDVPKWSGYRYFIEDNGILKFVTIGTFNFSPGASFAKGYTYALRPVTVIQIEK